MKHIRKLSAITITIVLCMSFLIAVPVSAAIPSIGSVAITPDPAYTDTALVATPSDGWFDEDGDPEGYQYQWQLWDGTSWLDIPAATTDTLDSSNFDVGDQIKIICTPFDGTDTGTPVEATITISGAIVAITPDPAYTDTSLTATPLHWVGIDSFEYQWQLWDGTSWLDIPTATTDALDSSNFVKDDQVKVICTPVINSVAGTPVEAIITISNSLPLITGVTIAPDPAYTDSILVASPEGWFDADSDPEGYQYQWQLWDGTSWIDIIGATTDTLDNTNFALNDPIKVICTPFDGTDTGTPAEATVNIGAFNYDAGIDVKPGSDENPVNLGSNGVIPVAIYTTEGFDAVAVDVGTVKFGPNGASPAHFAYEDIDEDGDIDLILHFRTQDTGIGEDDTEVTLTGETDSGMAFSGTDVIKVVPSKAKTKEAVQGNEDAPGQNKEPGESAEGKAKGKESAPGQNKEPGESAEGKAKNKESAPGQNKEPGEKAEGKAKGKNK